MPVIIIHHQDDAWFVSFIKTICSRTVKNCEFRSSGLSSYWHLQRSITEERCRMTKSKGTSKSVLRGRCSFIEAEHKENGWYLLKYIEVTNEIGMYLTDHIIPLLSGPVWLLLVGGNDQFSLEVQACVVYEVFIAWKRKMVRLNISQRLTCTNV